MKIVEHYFDKTNGESKIILDLEPNQSIVYVTKHGLQLLDPKERVLEKEESNKILKFVEEYLEAIQQEDNPVIKDPSGEINL